MQSENDYSKLLSGKSQLGPYPMEKLKRVGKPTTLITDEIKRTVQGVANLARAGRGESGSTSNASPRVSGSTTLMSTALRSALDSVGAPQRIPSFGSSSDGQPSPALNREGTETTAGVADTQVRTRQTIAVVGGEPALEKIVMADNPSVLSRHIKSVSYFVGADVVGICELPQWAVYSHDLQGNPIECNHKYAICIVVDQGRETMDASSGNDWMPATLATRAYAMCGFIGSIVADYIRRLGYSARLNYLRDYQVVVPPLLLLSGIGEISRANIVLNPFLGLRYKASVVTTDLPLEPDKPIDFGLQDFCNKCKKCATECPTGSLSFGKKVMRNGYENWEFDNETCRKYRSNPKGISCGKCIKVCPWNKPEGWTHELVRWMVGHMPYMNSFFVKMDNICGYGKPNIDRKWWFDPQNPE